ncbi:MAG TPA: PDZ domain-containing protein, partial [Blastocatellia bacterium]
DYEMTVAEMVARIQDTHGFVRGLRNLESHLGAFAPPLRLASAGGKLVVAELTDEAAAQAAGVRRGDVILAINGEPAAQRIAALADFRRCPRRSPLTPTSTRWRCEAPKIAKSSCDSKGRTGRRARLK